MSIMYLKRASFLSLAAVLFAIGNCPLVADQPNPQVQLLWTSTIPSVAEDLSGLDRRLEDGTPHNQLGGFSAIEYSGRDDLYWVLPDRGPKDGAVDYRCRIHCLRIIPNGSSGVEAKLVQTNFLRDAEEGFFSGALALVPSDWQQRGAALDPEAIRLTATGNLVISDEYGPFIDLFDSSGKSLGSWQLPEDLRLPRGSDATIATYGAVPNRGLEGLAICPGGKRIVAAFQGSLIQDSDLRDGKRNGRYCRLLVLDGLSTNTPIQQQFAYRLESRENGISEILAIDENRFVVLERDSSPFSKSRCKSLFLIDVRNASNVSGVQHLPVDAGILEGLKAVEKSSFIDLLDEQFGLKRLPGLEKIEGITWGPPLADGRRQLVVCADNDFDAKRNTQIFAFAVRIDE